MTSRVAYIDRPLLAKNFQEGDRVRYFNPVNARLSAWEGTVTAIHYGTGFIDVETPVGNERLGPETLILVGRDRLMEDTSLSTYDRALYREREGDPAYSYAQPETLRRAPAGRVVAAYRQKIASAIFGAASVASGHDSELAAYNKAFRLLSSGYTDEEIRDAVRIAHGKLKLALYWKATGRQYMPTQEELETGQFTCPRCPTDPVLQRTNYKKHVRLYACPECLFLIKPSDILDKTRPDDEAEVEELEAVPSGDFIEPKGSDAVQQALKKS